MTHPPSIIVRQMLIASQLVRSPSTQGEQAPCYVSQLPDTPHAVSTAACVYDTVGIADERLLRGEVIDYPGVQIRVQSPDYVTGWSLMESVRAALDGVLNASVTLDSSVYHVHSLRRTSPVFSIGNQSGSKRMEVFTLNLLCTVRELQS